MQIETLKTQQIQLLARKAQLLDELKAVETAIGQVGAILNFHEQAPAPEPAAE